MSDKKIKQLLDSYIQKTITIDEFQSLKHIIISSSYESIDKLLKLSWYEYHDNKSAKDNLNDRSYKECLQLIEKLYNRDSN